jgi:hypothetical protein
VEEMISTPENPTELSTTEVQSSLGAEDMTMKMIDEELKLFVHVSGSFFIGVFIQMIAKTKGCQTLLVVYLRWCYISN